MALAIFFLSKLYEKQRPKVGLKLTRLQFYFNGKLTKVTSSFRRQRNKE